MFVGKSPPTPAYNSTEDKDSVLSIFLISQDNWRNVLHKFMFARCRI